MLITVFRCFLHQQNMHGKQDNTQSVPHLIICWMLQSPEIRVCRKATCKQYNWCNFLNLTVLALKCLKHTAISMTYFPMCV